VSNPYRLLGGVICLLLVSMAPAVRAESAKVRKLEAQVEQLEAQNEALMERMDALEKQLSGMGKPEGGTEPATSLPEATTAVPESDDDGVILDVRWDDGLRFGSRDGDFEFRLGGRVYFDAATFDAPHYWFLGGDNVDEHDGTSISRLRGGLSGHLYNDLLFKVEADFAQDDVDVTDAYVGIRNLPYVGTFRVGQFSEPMGLEALTSSRFITFMERSMVTQALIPYRSRGLDLSNTFFNNRMTASLGVFNDGIDRDSYWSFTGRVTGLPWYADEGRRLLHLGAAFSHRNPDGDYDFRAYPGSNQANYHLRTGELPADEVEVWGLEGALVLGPFALQSELLRSDLVFMREHRNLTFFNLDRPLKMPDRHFDGYYVQASYFLTGENRMYDPITGSFGRVIPRRNFLPRNGDWGALELALRYDMLDLDDFDVRSGVIGGKARNWTAGVNWYLNPNMRVMLNYVRSQIDQWEYNGTLNVFQARFQTDF